MRSQSRSVARSSHGCENPRPCSRPAIWPVETREAGEPGSGTHHGARGQPSMVGSTNVEPPSAGAWACSQSQAPETRPASQASASSRMPSASAIAAGWVAGSRPSGSRPWPNPPSGLRYAATASLTGVASPPANSRSSLRRSTTRPLAARNWVAASRSGLLIPPANHVTRPAVLNEADTGSD